MEVLGGHLMFLSETLNGNIKCSLNTVWNFEWEHHVVANAPFSKSWMGILGGYPIPPPKLWVGVPNSRSMLLTKNLNGSIEQLTYFPLGTCLGCNRRLLDVPLMSFWWGESSGLLILPCKFFVGKIEQPPDPPLRILCGEMANSPLLVFSNTILFTNH